MHRLVLIFLVFLSLNAGAQKKYFITTNWLFNAGDSIAWAETNYNDQQWNRVDAGKPWQEFNPENGQYGWYRYHLTLSKNLKPAVHQIGFFKINFGYANEAAQYFFNGRGLGQSGSLPPRFIRANLSKPIEFYISEDEICWDTINIISVRIFSADSSRSGLIKGPVFYYVPFRLE